MLSAVSLPWLLGLAHRGDAASSVLCSMFITSINFNPCYLLLLFMAELFLARAGAAQSPGSGAVWVAVGLRCGSLLLVTLLLVVTGMSFYFFF